MEINGQVISGVINDILNFKNNVVQLLDKTDYADILYKQRCLLLI